MKINSLDEAGNPYDFIVVIDAGSHGTRAHLYRTRMFARDQSSMASSASADDSESDSEDEDSTKPSWADVNELDKKNVNYPVIELIKRKKIKPGIATFVNNPKKLRAKYIGKILKEIKKYIPKDQIARTPVFLHATGGMRLLRPEDQNVILDEICTYIQKSTEFYLPDCSSHINSISGEVEGLYSWIGLNYKYGVFDAQLEDKSTYGALDMGGVSSQIAFEPSNIAQGDDADYLFKVSLNYLDPQDESHFSYKVLSESFRAGMNQAHSKYDDKLIEKGELVDPCLPTGYIKTVTTTQGEKVDIQGSSDFKGCLNTQFDVLSEISKDKYCDPSDSMTTTSCLLSDTIPKMEFNVKKFIGINEFYSNLKELMDYKDSYDRAGKICGYTYTDLLQQKEFADEDEPEKNSEICFKSAWIINVLHQGVGFPRYGIDDVSEEQDKSKDTSGPPELILDKFSWTLGRAVLYTFFETASRLNNETMPRVGYFEPSSQVFVPGGEAVGIPTRPAYREDYYALDEGQEAVDDDEDDDDDMWDNVEDHRIWGSLSFLLILMIVGYLLLGRTKRQSIKDAVKRVLANKFKFSGVQYQEPMDMDQEDLELGVREVARGEEEEGAEDTEEHRDDSFEIE